MVCAAALVSALFIIPHIGSVLSVLNLDMYGGSSDWNLGKHG